MRSMTKMKIKSVCKWLEVIGNWSWMHSQSTNHACRFHLTINLCLQDHTFLKLQKLVDLLACLEYVILCCSNEWNNVWLLLSWLLRIWWSWNFIFLDKELVGVFDRIFACFFDLLHDLFLLPHSSFVTQLNPSLLDSLLHPWWCLCSRQRFWKA